MTITEAQKKHESALKLLPNFVGTAQGEKIQAGKRIGRIAIVVFVKVKVSETDLLPSDIIPKMLEGYLTDVVETGEVFALHA